MMFSGGTSAWMFYTEAEHVAALVAELSDAVCHPVCNLLGSARGRVAWVSIPPQNASDSVA
jgi:hypothetical protein